ncbi:MAG: penicillin-binding protein 2, partial [Phaeodactylibacter sp.]|nr:penicillin-binding protein 2 [Phaeodactylibacter sp.]
KDNLGQNISKFQDGALDVPAVSGNDLMITLDIELQQFGEELMKNKIGGIVAIEPHTGEVLAMVSSPTYDPNELVIDRDRGEAVARLSADSLKPFFNRAVMAQYPPGSTFKPVVGLVAMEEGLMTKDRGLTCPGYYYYNGTSWGCRNHPYPSNVGKAIQWSCNTYFFQVFRWIVDKGGFYSPEIGLSLFVDYLNKFGLGHTLGIDFPGEQKGFVPTVEYYDNKYPKDLGSWKSPTIISVGIGQGELLLTNLQMANMAATIANKGYYYIPHLAKEFLDTTLQVDQKYHQRNLVDIDSSLFDPVIEGMELVVNVGSGRGAFTQGIRIAGKTGTVQNPHGQDHSTFVAFAPVENPQIAIAVYVENAGGGGRFAAPIAGLMLEKYINREIGPTKTWLEESIKNANLIHRP